MYLNIAAARDLDRALNLTIGRASPLPIALSAPNLGQRLSGGVLDQSLEITRRIVSSGSEAGDLGIEQQLTGFSENLVALLVTHGIAAAGLGGDLSQQLAEAFDKNLPSRGRVRPAGLRGAKQMR